MEQAAQASQRLAHLRFDGLDGNLHFGGYFGVRELFAAAFEEDVAAAAGQLRDGLVHELHDLVGFDLQRLGAGENLPQLFERDVGKTVVAQAVERPVAHGAEQIGAYRDGDPQLCGVLPDMGVDIEYDLFGRSAVAEPELGEAAQRRIVAVKQLPEGGNFPPPVRFSTIGESRIRYLTCTGLYCIYQYIKVMNLGDIKAI